MLRIARLPLRASRSTTSFAARQASSKPPATGANAAPKSNPVAQSKPAGGAPAEVDSGFRGKVTAFMLIQGVVLAVFGVAHKMEDDAAFATKMEQYYDVGGVKPTLETFRAIVRTIQPPVKKTDSTPPAAKLAAEPTQEVAAAVAVPEPAVVEAPSPPAEQQHEGEEESVTVQHEVEVYNSTNVEAEAEEEDPATATAVTNEESAPAPKHHVDAASQQKIEELEQKLARYATESAAILEKMQAAEARRVEQEEREQHKAVVLPIVDAEVRARDVKVTTSEAVLEEMSRHALKTRQDLQFSLLQDLHELSDAELRQRIQQLAAEFFERTKWEGLRLHDSLKQLEEELTSKYTGILQEQRSQLQVELERALSQREKDVTARFEAERASIDRRQEEAVSAAVKAQAAGFHESQQKQLEEETEKLKQLFADEYNLQLALMKNEQVKQLMRVQDEVEQVKAELTAYRNVVDQITEVQQQTRAMNVQAAAIMGLESSLATAVPLASVVSALKKSCADNALIVAALDSIPSHGLKAGIPTLPDLRLRFKVVRKEVRRASLIPENVPNFLGQVVGTALASITWSPSEGSRVDDSVGAEGKDVEDHLAAIAQFLEGGRLSDAVAEAEHITGYPRMLMQDWETAAKERLIADKVVKVLKAEAALKHHQLSRS